MLGDRALTAALVSHALAWVAVVLLVFMPFYRGESATATPKGAIPGEVVQSTATLIEVNGWGVLPILLVPVVISGIGLLAALVAGRGLILRRAPLVIAGLLLMGFCIAGSFTIGMFYLPAALAMAVSGAASFVQRRERAVKS